MAATGQVTADGGAGREGLGKALALLVVATVVAFSPALVAGFLNWDDNFMVVDNPHLQRPSLSTVSWAFTTFTMGHYQPLSWLSLLLDRLVWGLRPFSFHLTNLIWHVLNALLVFGLIRELLAAFSERSLHSLRSGPILLATLLWAVHPMRVESVVWITERRDVLSGFFLFASAWAYSRWRQGRPSGAGLSGEGLSEGRSHASRLYALALVFYAASLLSKASGVVYPAVLLVLELLFMARGSRGPQSRPTPSRVAGRLTVKLLPFAALAGIATALAPRAQAASSALVPLSELGVGERSLVAAHGWVYYLWRFVWPQDLSPLYEMPLDVVWTEPRFLLSCLVVVAALSSIGLLLIRRSGAALPMIAGAAIYTLLLLPVLGFFQSGPQLVADRYSYLPAVVLSAGLGALLLRDPSPPRSGTKLLVITLVAAAMVSTFAYSLSWRTTTELWQAAVTSQPECSLCHEGLAIELFLQGELDRAEPHLRFALEQRPNLPRATYVMARILDQRGEMAEALDLYRRAAVLDPGNGPILERSKEIARELETSAPDSSAPE